MRDPVRDFVQKTAQDSDKHTSPGQAEQSYDSGPGNSNQKTINHQPAQDSDRELSGFLGLLSDWNNLNITTQNIIMKIIEADKAMPESIRAALWALLSVL